MDAINVPDHVIRYESLKCFGEFESFSTIDYQQRWGEYTYQVIDAADVTFEIKIRHYNEEKEFETGVNLLKDSQINPDDMRHTVSKNPQQSTYSYIYGDIHYYYFYNELFRIEIMKGCAEYIIVGGSQDIMGYGKLIHLDTAQEIAEMLPSSPPVE